MALPNNPQTRKEMYLSNMAGQGTALPSEPHTREEEYLDYIAKNGGGGGTGEGDMTKAVYDDDLAVASAGGIADYVAGAITGKVDKVQGKGLSTNDYDDSAKAIVDGVTTELGNKADKVSSATNGDLASLDSNGNLTDSGKKASDFYNSSETLETELDGQDKFPFYDFSASAKRQVTFGSIKAKLKEYFDLFYTNLVSSATNGNFAGLDANGNLTDSGKKASDFATASSVTAILDGTDIDSFGDVETALATKVDKVTGKGLSTNDYDNTAKGIVDNIQSNVIANTKLIKDTVGWSGKNKWDKSKTTGIDATITQTSDGFRAQVSNHTWGSARCDFPTPAKNKDFILTCKANVTTAGNFMKMQVYGSTDGSDYSNSIAVTDTYSATKELELAFNSGNYNYLRITLYLTNGTAASADVTFEKPMLSDADILDSTYEPYFGSTAFPRSEQAVLGAKNLLRPTLTTFTTNGVTFTVNEDKTITVNGTATADIYCPVFNREYAPELSQGSYLVSGGVAETTNYKFYLQERNAANTDWGRAYYDTTGEGVQYDRTTDVRYAVFIWVKSGATLNNVKFYPMITLASDTDRTFAPYAMTNKQLTETAQQLTDAVNVLNSYHYRIEAKGEVQEVTINTVNGFTNMFIAGFDNASRRFYMVTQLSNNGTQIDTIMTAGTTGTDVTVTHLGEKAFKISVPTWWLVTIISPQPFSVS